jgi:hypothetical protein
MGRSCLRCPATAEGVLETGRSSRDGKWLNRIRGELFSLSGTSVKVAKCIKSATVTVEKQPESAQSTVPFPAAITARRISPNRGR